MPHDNDSVHGSNDLLVRSLHVRAVRTETRQADFVASTDAIDSYGEIIEQSWDLDRYKANPTVLWAHQSRELPIGQATDVAVVNGELRATIQFASAKANPMAENVWQSIQERTLRAVSVGFLPKSVRLEKRNDKEVAVLADNDLFEISVTPIPANPEALARMRARALQTQAHPPAIERGGEEENTMTEEKAKAALDAKEKEVSEALRMAAETESKFKALEAQTERLVAERDAQSKRADALEARALASEAMLVEREVDALIGVKIDPSEKENFVELAKSNRELFSKMVAQRGTLATLKHVVGADPIPPVSAESTAADTGELASLALSQLGA